MCVASVAGDGASMKAYSWDVSFLNKNQNFTVFYQGCMLVLYALGLQTLIWVGSCGDDAWFFFCTRDSGWIGSGCCLCEDGLVVDMGGNRSGIPCP